MVQRYKGIDFFDSYITDLISKFNHNQEAITVNFRELVPSIVKMDRYTHFIHSYPAKLLQQIPYFFLNNSIFSKQNDIVLDPFCGTGTVLLEASLANREAIGIDVNPLAALIAKTKTTKVNIFGLKKELEIIENLFKIYKSSKKHYYVPKISNIEHWYSKKNIRKLSKIKDIINQINDAEIKEFYLVIFSISCKKFSYSDPRISVPVRINYEKFPKGHALREAAIKNLKFIDKSEVFEFFIEQAKKNIERLTEYQNSVMLNSNTVKVYNSDIKELASKTIQENSVQLILTSPPYVSAQKYIRASSLSLQWLELNKSSIADLNKQSVGREDFSILECKQFHSTGFESVDTLLIKIYEKNKLRAYITYTYLIEMKESFSKFYNLLKKDGYFVMVIGNNTIAGFEFMTHEYLIEIAESIGFLTKLILIDDIKSRGLMTKRNKTASVISREYIVIFKKVI
jgi:tRNA G10  N-methylase Trm11